MTIRKNITKIKTESGDYDILYSQTSSDQVIASNPLPSIGTAAGANQAEINAAIDRKMAEKLFDLRYPVVTYDEQGRIATLTEKADGQTLKTLTVTYDSKSRVDTLTEQSFEEGNTYTVTSTVIYDQINGRIVTIDPVLA